MILQALKEYYDRKAENGDIVPLGWERKPIPFIVVIDESGSLVNIEDTRSKEDKQGHEFIVPHEVKRTGKNFIANILWDKAEYVFGLDGNETDAQRKKLMAFNERLDQYEEVHEVAILKKFLVSSEEIRKVRSHICWHDMNEKNLNLTFRLLHSKDIICRTSDFVDLYNLNFTKQGDDIGLCIVSGECLDIARTHAAIKGVLNAKSSGANIISFDKDAFCSYRKTQGYNAPVGKKVAFAYTTALNTLLARDSRQKLTIGDSTVVFWSDKNSSFEDEMVTIFDDRDRKDNPDALTGAVAQLLTSVKSGAYHEDHEPTRFFVLGLAPNSARISVRFWHQGTVEEMSGRFASWFEDLMIAHGDKMKEHLSMYRLLCAIAPLGKAENIPPNLAGNVMRSILDGTPLPETLLHAALRRGSVDHPKPQNGQKKDWEFERRMYARAKLIKACLNRKFRFQKSTEKEIKIMLDKDNVNIGYRLGRLFAVLEKIQKDANPGINATIRDKYYASASSTPAVVFGTLMRLASSHLSKLAKEKPGWKVTLERLIGEITYKDSESIGISKFPSHLKLDDQGQFAIGYYHQWQAGFTSKDSSENVSND